MTEKSNERLYIVIEKDPDLVNPYGEKVYGYYLDPTIAKNEVKWLASLGVEARISISRIDTRRL